AVRPWGAHPLVDPRWSTEAVDVVHDGCEANRIEKIRRQIASSPLALQSLRVCWRGDSASYNCGECPKCLRTMLALHLAGTLPRATTFPPNFAPTTAVRRMLLPVFRPQDMVSDIRAALGTSPADRRIGRAIARTMRTHRVLTLARRHPSIRRAGQPFRRLVDPWRAR